MYVTLDPARGWLTVTDTLTVPASLVREGTVDFLLHGALGLMRSTPPASRVPLRTGSRDDATRFFGINASRPTSTRMLPRAGA